MSSEPDDEEYDLCTLVESEGVGSCILKFRSSAASIVVRSVCKMFAKRGLEVFGGNLQMRVTEEVEETGETGGGFKVISWLMDLLC
uniref:Uncharacterized protein n=1 Tax=Chromera velia CCMP2878 TaxID=1169474 RepID=A0A0G4FKA2_9ALVE|eukprot:Cvel_17315.t1-p1 / transcript=Cvel_17315.t1 / gene=Cvel_17315 / organism=Chromera_velia_CCMP2878 / gene_product=hypothetical protein / transcript_product=hypothetical protein / location=Cvel_scaffold1375:17560-17814(-) / protein_length=85 / sequence_SO=supercontig / SO=protein_coding / is_pseudo=false